ncbi:hypothetical protein E1A91_D08G061000v1 [Gossypium mustelinum]|uniref:Uncharacterized protein n=1 Tax=Gossypium mustelinum TaxID=34275 RepID=A0A5D2TTV5_GOSMU|nr:hypothetical protein E1A91_D08G061000v1 [Gossypium mustelinum]
MKLKIVRPLPPPTAEIPFCAQIPKPVPPPRTNLQHLEPDKFPLQQPLLYSL